MVVVEDSAVVAVRSWWRWRIPGAVEAAVAVAAEADAGSRANLERQVAGATYEIQIRESEIPRTCFDSADGDMGVRVRMGAAICCAFCRENYPAYYRHHPQGVKGFDTPQKAADGLFDAAEKFDVAALAEIFGPEGDDIVFSEEYPRDQKRAADFAAQAREKNSISIDPKTDNRAFLLVGDTRGHSRCR